MTFLCLSKLTWYAILSTLVTFSVVQYAYLSRQQFFPTVSYLMTSKVCVLTLINQAVISVFLFGNLIQKVFLGKLSMREKERVHEALKFTIVEFALALTLFREELGPQVLLLFFVLFFFKFFHVVLDERIDTLTQHHGDPNQPPVPKFTHVRLISLTSILFCTNGISVSIFSQMLVDKGVSVLLLFLFEYSLLALEVTRIAYKYTLLFLSRGLAVMGPDGTYQPWQERQLYALYGQLFVNVIKLAVYVVYFCLIASFFGMPLVMLRDVIRAFSDAKREITNLLAVRRLKKQMNKVFVPPTAEDLQKYDPLCSICHDDITDAPESLAASVLFPCSHMFHRECILHWFHQQQRCPMCSTNIDELVARAEKQKRDKERAEATVAYHTATEEQTEATTQDDGVSGVQAQADATAVPGTSGAPEVEGSNVPPMATASSAATGGDDIPRAATVSADRVSEPTPDTAIPTATTTSDMFASAPNTPAVPATAEKTVDLLAKLKDEMRRKYQSQVQRRVLGRGDEIGVQAIPATGETSLDASVHVQDEVAPAPASITEEDTLQETRKLTASGAAVAGALQTVTTPVMPLLPASTSASASSTAGEILVPPSPYIPASPYAPVTGPSPLHTPTLRTMRSRGLFTGHNTPSAYGTPATPEQRKAMLETQIRELERRIHILKSARKSQRNTPSATPFATPFTSAMVNDGRALVASLQAPSPLIRHEPIFEAINRAANVATATTAVSQASVRSTPPGSMVATLDEKDILTPMPQLQDQLNRSVDSILTTPVTEEQRRAINLKRQALLLQHKQLEIEIEQIRLAQLMNESQSDVKSTNDQNNSDASTTGYEKNSLIEVEQQKWDAELIPEDANGLGSDKSVGSGRHINAPLPPSPPSSTLTSAATTANSSPNVLFPYPETPTFRTLSADGSITEDSSNK